MTNLTNIQGNPMAEVLNLYDAKTHLSQLVERAASGEEIIIAKAGKPMAKLTALSEENLGKRQSGVWKGELWIAEDFDAPLPAEVLDAFEGNE